MGYARAGMSVHVPDSEQEPDWPAVAAALLDALCDAPDQATAVDRMLAVLQPVRCYGDVLSLGRELTLLRSRVSGSERKVACSALAQCLYRNAVPMQPPLTTGLVAVVVLLAMLVAVIGDHATIALVLALPLAAMLVRIGLFAVRNRRADHAEPARLPNRSQLLALRWMRSLPPGPAS
jgi:uncharacterized membrane protein